MSDWGRSFTYNRNRSGSRIEHCVTLYLNVPASEKISIQTENVLLGLKPLIKDVRTPKHFICSRKTTWLKVSHAF